MTDHGTSSKRLAAVALICEIVGFSLTLVAAFGTTWIIIDNEIDGSTLHEGIWLASYCRNKTCQTFSRNKIFEHVEEGRYVAALDEDHWVEFKVLSLLAIVCSLTAVLTTTIFLVRKSTKHQVPVLIISGVTTLSSSMLLLVPVLKTFTVNTDVPFMAAWTQLVATACVSIQFIATIIYVLSVYQCLQYCCAVKHRNSLHRRRAELVVRYLASQSHTHNAMERNDPYLQPNTMQCDTQRADRSNDFTDISYQQPYTINDNLPLYSEVVFE